jgi:hypothetical protein
MNSLSDTTQTLEGLIESLELSERGAKAQQMGREYVTVLRLIKTLKSNMKAVKGMNLRQLSKVIPRDSRAPASRKTAEALGVPVNIQKAAKALAAITKENFANARSSFYTSVKTLPDQIREPAMAVMMAVHSETNNRHFRSGIPTMSFFRNYPYLIDSIKQYEAALKGRTDWEFERPVGESLEEALTLLESMKADDQVFKRALQLFSEHEMNVDAGDERPERGFDAVMELVDKHNDGQRLTDKQKNTVIKYVRTTRQGNYL